MIRRYFTPEEDDYILANYSHRTLVRMGEHLGRRCEVVRQRAKILARQGRLNLQDRCYSRPWSQTDLDYLNDNWGLMPDERVAGHLKRSVNACKIKTKRAMGISRKTNFWTARDVARLFGVDEHAVRELWIQHGCLKARRSCVRAGGGTWAWEIRDEAIEQFIKRYPWHYDWRRMERDTWYRQLAEKVWRTDPWLRTAEAAVEMGVHKETVSRHIRRGWLQAERTWEAGQGGGYRVPRSALAGFRLKKKPVEASPALRAWYERNAREEATG